MRFVAVLSLLLTMVPESHAADVPPVRQVIERGLRFLADDALAWKRDHNCASCHHAALPVWVMREAKQRGYQVEEAVMSDMTKWIAETGEGKTGVPRPATVPRVLNTKAIWIALALNADPEPDEMSRNGLKRMLKTIRGDQTEDGSWHAWPETRPPMFGNSNEVMTAQAVLALLPAAAAGDEESKLVRDKGWQWLSKTKSDDDPQSTALRLLIATRLERPADEWQPLARRIIERQNTDGGWSQAADMSSDAWATGQALYALSHASTQPTDPVIQRAILFLANTQRDDGSWPMTSRPAKPEESGASLLVPITGAGASWAVLGLIRNEPPRSAE